MSQDIFVKASRNGAPVRGLEAVPVRLDRISLQTVAASGGAIPYNSYQLISLEGVPDFRQGDQLTDIFKETFYRVCGEPDIHDESHLEVLIEEQKQRQVTL